MPDVNDNDILRNVYFRVTYPDRLTTGIRLNCDVKKPNVNHVTLDEWRRRRPSVVWDFHDDFYHSVNLNNDISLLRMQA